MIEFRLHEGRQQFRTWKVIIDRECWGHPIHASEEYDPKKGKYNVDWTEWQDIPVMQADSMEYDNPPPISTRTIKMQSVPEEIKQNCMSCRFWEPQYNDPIDHCVCRFNPKYIKRYGTDWCGQWQQKRV